MSNQTISQAGVLPKKPKLSVCMIVRDEEKMLPHCLKSVRSVADELIVVDTGSKDNTISIAKGFGAKVYHFEWCDDFATARNECLKHATSDWILQIDADEKLIRSSIQLLRKAIRNPWCLFYLIKCDQGPRDELARYVWVARLFRNHPLVRYNRPYHETIVDSTERLIRREPSWEVHREPGITIRHYGYELSMMSEKQERGRRIMESYLTKHPNDWYTLSQLGSVYLAQALNDQAGSCLKKAIKINPNCPYTNYTMGLLLQRQGRTKEVIEYFKKATSGDSLLAEAHVWLGGIWIDKGMHDEAISELKKALTINPNIALGHSNMGLAYILKGMYDSGITHLKKSISLDQSLANPHVNLGLAYARMGMLDEALNEFKEALRLDSAYGKAHYNVAIIYYKKGEYHKAIKHYDRASELGERGHPKLQELLEPYR
jgi:tetratricopeptide (TPR) repeat protein